MRRVSLGIAMRWNGKRKRDKERFVATFAGIHADIPASDPAWRHDEERGEKEDE